MAKPVANVDIATDTFGGWVTQTNKLLDALTNEILTANSEANGSLVTGNAFVIGILGSNNVVVDSALRGGNVQTLATLNIISDVAVSGNLTVNSTAVFVRLQTNTSISAANLFCNAVNSTLNGNTLNIGSNTVVVTSNTITLNNVNIGSNVIFNTNHTLIVSANANLGTGLTPLPVFTFPKATYSSGKITAQSQLGTNTQINELVVAQDTTTNTAQLTVYATIVAPAGANLGVYSVSTDASNVIVSFAQTQNNSSVKIVANLIK